MADDPSRSLQTIRRCTAELNSIADEARETIASVESFLRDECCVGVSACVKVSESDGNEGLWLEYRRIKGKFRIALVVADPGGDDLAVTPWLEASQADKLEALPKLGQLLAEISKK